jgi:hypothetical protein
MFAPFRLTRLLFIGLAACAVTWAMAGAALALPIVPQREEVTTDSRPPFKDVAGDVQEPATAARPDFKVVPGDVKAPQAAGRPDFRAVAGDVKSDADRARAVPPVTSTDPVRVLAPRTDDDTSTIALIVSIAAILAALGAVTLTVTRPPRGGALGA